MLKQLDRFDRSNKFRQAQLAFVRSALMPGLGQLIAGHKTAGGLFLAAGTTNLLLMALVLMAVPITHALISFGEINHLRLNESMMASLRGFALGSPMSIALIMMFAAFNLYAGRDAFDRVLRKTYDKLYSSHFVPLQEAASASYLFHFSLMAALAILVAFFFIPAPRQAQQVVIEFQTDTNEAQPIKKPDIKTPRAPRMSRDAGQIKRISQANAHTNAPANAHANAHTNAPAAPTPRVQAPTPSLQTPTPRVQTPTPRSQAPTPSLQAPTPSLQAPTPSLHAPTQSLQAPTPSPQSPSPSPMAIAPISVSAAQAPRLPAASASGSANNAAAPQPVAIATANTEVAPEIVSGVAGSGARRRERGAGDSGAIAPRRATGGMPGGAGGPQAMGKPDLSSPPSSSLGKGAPGVNAVPEVNWGPYMSALQQRIKRAWFPPKDTTSKRITVTFKVARDGTLTNLRVVRTSGLQIADSAALKAVESAAPFANLPSGAPEQVDIEFTFDYNVFGGRRF